jgi:hypothetical protein
MPRKFFGGVPRAPKPQAQKTDLRCNPVVSIAPLSSLLSVRELNLSQSAIGNRSQLSSPILTLNPPINWNKKLGTSNTADSIFLGWESFQRAWLRSESPIFAVEHRVPSFHVTTAFAFNLYITSFYVLVSTGRGSNLRPCSRTYVSVVKSVPGPCSRGLTT